MNWFTGIIVTLVAIIVIAGLVFVLYGRENTWRAIAGDPDLGPFDLTNLTRSDRPNDALLCTPGLCDGVNVDAPLPAYDMTVDALMAVLNEQINAQPDIKERVDNGENPAALRYVTWTNTMRFPDTNQFLAVDLGDGRTGLIAYARAQLGYSDQGNNRARLERWTAGLPSQ